MKKFLSLVLALIMTMSLVTISAGAKDFTDADEVNYDEAIDVLSALKVVEGYPDESFKPAKTLTRAEAAKIICNMILGPTTAAALSASVAPFSDVAADNWAAGYITYCAQQGIISGYGNGAFGPTDTLTGYQFMKMLLGALGYDAKIEGYVGTNYSIPVAKQAANLGLSKGLKETFNGNDDVTREEACLYALNTLKADLVEYKTSLTVNNGALDTLNVAKAQQWNNSATKIENIKADDYIQFAEQYFPKLELEVGNGIYGRPTNVWKLKKVEIGAYTSIEPTYVYTESTKGKDVYKDLGKVVCDKDEYDWAVYVDGKAEKAADIAYPKKGDDNDWAYTGEGTVTEIYVDDDKDTVTVCEINYYLGEVTKVKSDDDGEYINVTAMSDTKLNDKKFYVEGYEEEDLIVFTRDWNEDDEYVIGEVCEPETVTGEVTRVEKDKDNDNTYLRVAGEKIPYSDHNYYDVTESTMKAVHPELTKDYIIYMDPNGYVLGFELAEKTVDQYLYVLDTHESLSKQAKVLLANGTVEEIKVDDVTYASDVENPDFETDLNDTICTYTVDSKGVYDLEVVEDTHIEAWNSKASEINNGRAYVNAAGTTFIVDKKTVFTDYDGETAYTGYDEVPNVENATLAYVLNSKDIAKIVFILQGDKYDADSTYFMLSSTKHESLKYDGKYYREYFNAYVNGEKTTLNVRYNALNGGTDETGLTAGVLYQVKKTVDEDYIVDVKPVTGELIQKGVKSVGAEAFWLDFTPASGDLKDAQFDVDDDTVFVVVDYKADGDVDSIYEGKLKHMDDEDYDILVSVVKKSDETAKLVYIERTPVAEKSDDASVKSITVKGIDVGTIVDGKTYTVDVPKAVNEGSEQKVKVITNDDAAKIEIFEGTSTTNIYTDDNLKKNIEFTGMTGDYTSFKVVVTSEDGSEKTTVTLKIKTAAAYAPLEMKASVPTTAAKVEGTTIKLASDGTDLTVAELIALFKTAPKVVVKNAYGVEIDASKLTVKVASSSPYTMTITFDGQSYNVALSETLA